MAKKKEVRQPITKEELIEQAKKCWIFDHTPEDLIPIPTRTFVVGEQVKVGNLKEVFIEQIIFDGKAYVYCCKWTDRENPEGYIKYMTNWWFNVEKHQARNDDIPRLMSSFRIFQASVSDLDSLLHHMSAGGLVLDPNYQREYVWSEENKDALIESIFDGLDIGAFLLVRNHGYLHNGDKTLRAYRTLDQRLVQIPAEEDYSVSIVDGQQRLTTICDFIQDRRAYKGIHFSQLHWRDQIEFMQKSVSFRIINEEQTNKKEILRMFLQSNRGVPQAPEHIAKIQALYDAM